MINEAFKSYLEEAIGSENALVAFSAFAQPASAAVRLNPFKKCCGYESGQVQWSRWGRILEHRPVFTLDPMFHAGAFYVQDSSSMFVGEIFRRVLDEISIPSGRPVRVLDLCAAPGGKTTDLAASLRERFGGDFILVANEVMKQRAGVLAGNVAIWGDPNVVVTSDDPSSFSILKSYFDVVVADVPCSGEGMFRKDEDAQKQWSENNVSLCEGRQKRILADVWPSLVEGGVLVYSTCTFNKYENDGNVEWMKSEFNAASLSCLRDVDHEGVIKTSQGFSLVPGFVPGEGQYCSAVMKTETGKDVSIPRKSFGNKSRAESLPSYLKDLFTVDVALKRRGETVIAVPSNISSEVAFLENHLHVLASGSALGVIKGKDLVPDADLALSIILRQESFPTVEVDRQTALSFLHKDNIVLSAAPKGYVLIRYEGINIGFVKNLGNRCNNLHPQSRRIRMDIK